MPFFCGSAAVSCEVPWGLDLGVRLVNINIFTVSVMISHRYQHIMRRFVHVWNKLLVHCTPNNFFKWSASFRRHFSHSHIQRTQDCGYISTIGDCPQTGNLLKEGLRICAENHLNGSFHCNAATEVWSLAVQQYKYCVEVGKYVALVRSQEFHVWFCCSHVRKDVKY